MVILFVEVYLVDMKSCERRKELLGVIFCVFAET